MNKTIKTLAIAAVFCVVWTQGLPQGGNETAAPVATVSAQAAQAQVDQLPARIRAFARVNESPFLERLGKEEVLYWL